MAKYVCYVTVVSKAFVEADSKEEAEQKILNDDEESVDYGSSEISIEFV